jgi:hypothetical protein
LPFDVGDDSSCATLLTTRRTDIARDLVVSEDDDVFELKVLDEKSAFQLFQALAPDVAKTHDKESRALVEDLEGLPLSIQVAGRLLHSKSRAGWDIRGLIEEIRARLEVILGEPVPPNMNEIVKNLPRPVSTMITLRVLLKLSTDRLSSDAVRDRFADLGGLASKPWMFDIKDVLRLWGMKALEEAMPIIEELIDVGLIQRIDQPGDGKPRAKKSPKVWFTMHALLIEHARSLAVS